MPLNSNESTRDEEGVLEAEEEVAADVEDMFAASLPRKVSDEDTDIEALDTVVDSRTEEGYKTRAESDHSHQEAVLKDEHSSQESEEEESEGGEAEREDETEDGEAEEEGTPDEVSPEEQLRRTNAALMAQVNATAREEMHGTPPSAPVSPPAQEMVAQTAEAELPPAQPAPAQLDVSNLLSGITTEDVTAAFADETKFLSLLQRVAGEAAIKASEYAQLGVTAQVSRQVGTLSIIKDFMALGHNSDIREAPDALMQESVRIESRNPDMKSTEVLEAAADSLRKRYSMAPVSKSTAGENITKEIRTKAGVKPAQPRNAKPTRRRKAGENGKPVEPELTDIQKQIADMSAVGGGPDNRPLIR